jgi:hypothetical protein
VDEFEILEAQACNVRAGIQTGTSQFDNELSTIIHLDAKFIIFHEAERKVLYKLSQVKYKSRLHLH